jgi:Tfp pilus assembly protein PilF
MTPRIKSVLSTNTSDQRFHRGHLALGVLLAAISAVLIGGHQVAQETRDTRYIPTSNQEILTTLPALISKAARLRMAQPTASFASATERAVQTAQEYLRAWRQTGDARYLGYAEGAIAPWQHQPDAPTDIALINATLLQSRHQFDQAIEALTRITQQHPRHTDAWLALATVYTVTGQFTQAEDSCNPVINSAPLLAITCIANAKALRYPAHAIALLGNGLARFPSASAEERVWAYTLLGEIAARDAQAAVAEQAFASALSLNASDPYLLGAYTDFLLDQKKPEKVIQLLNPHRSNDGLLLRLAIAKRQIGAADWIQDRDELQQRFDALAQRNDAAIHRREHARFTLVLQDDPATALRYAEMNWQQQREAADIALLLHSAHAAHDRQAARRIAEWLETNRVTDRQLHQLVQSAAREHRS